MRVRRPALIGLSDLSVQKDCQDQGVPVYREEAFRSYQAEATG
ncbi:MAG: hypothetical protein ACOX1X_03025 [Dethiobacteria bacterium]|jgi:hypothetical protein